jgi:hypothetical protein
MKITPLALLSILATTTGFAQSPADRAISTLQGSAGRPAGGIPKMAASEQAAPELFPGEFDDVGPQFLLAPSREADKGGPTTEAGSHWLEAIADAQFLYTSNALLTEKGNSDTGLMITTLQAAANLPTIDFAGGQLATKIGYRHQWWMYSLHDSGSGLNDFDFAVSTFFIQARHTFGENWAVGLGLDYNRLLSRENDWTEFYTELMPSWYAERTFTFSEKASLTAGLYGAYHWTNTDDPVSHINDRLDTALGIAYTYALTPNLFAQPYYRIQWSHYTENSDRNDMYNSLGFALTYSINEWSAVRAFIGYENRNSTDTLVPDYDKWDTGLGVTLSMKF